MHLEFAISHGRTQQPQQPREFSEHEVNSGKKEQCNDERGMASVALHWHLRNSNEAIVKYLHTFLCARTVVFECACFNGKLNHAALCGRMIDWASALLAPDAIAAADKGRDNTRVEQAPDATALPWRLVVHSIRRGCSVVGQITRKLGVKKKGWFTSKQNLLSYYIIYKRFYSPFLALTSLNLLTLGFGSWCLLLRGLSRF